MKRSRLWLMLIPIVLVLLRNDAGGNGALRHMLRDQKHEAQASKQSDPSQNQQVILVSSPAYQAAILEALRAIVSEEVSRQKQEHTDYKRWNTPAFWFGDVGLVFVGAVYSFFAGWQLFVIRRQNEQFRITQRAQVSLGRPDGILMELIPPEAGQRLMIRMFFLNGGNTAAEQFFVQTAVGYIHGQPTWFAKGHRLDPQPRRTRVEHGVFGWATTPIGSHATHVVIAFSREILTESDIAAIGKGEFITVLGKFQYFDGFGTPEYRTFHTYYFPQTTEFFSGGAPFDGGYTLNPRTPGYSVTSIAEPSAGSARSGANPDADL
jgi:hypothetical protein